MDQTLAQEVASEEPLNVIMNEQSPVEGIAGDGNGGDNGGEGGVELKVIVGPTVEAAAEDERRKGEVVVGQDGDDESGQHHGEEGDKNDGKKEEQDDVEEEGQGDKEEEEQEQDKDGGVVEEDGEEGVQDGQDGGRGGVEATVGVTVEAAAEEESQEAEVAVGVTVEAAAEEENQEAEVAVRQDDREESGEHHGEEGGQHHGEGSGQNNEAEEEQDENEEEEEEEEEEGDGGGQGSGGGVAPPLNVGLGGGPAANVGGGPPPGAGGAPNPPPPVTFDEIIGFTPDQVVEWLDGMGFFTQFGNATQVAGFRASFIEQGLSGALLIESGGDLDELMRSLKYGPAARISKIIKKVIRNKGYVPPKFRPSGWFDMTVDFFDKQKWVLGTGGVAAGTLVGSGFHLADLEMHPLPPVVRPFFNAGYHFSYLFTASLALGWGGRWGFERLRRKYSHAARAHAQE